MIEFFFLFLGDYLKSYFFILNSLGINIIISIFILSLIIKLITFFPEKKIKIYTNLKSEYFLKVKKCVNKSTKNLKGQDKFEETSKIYDKFKYNPIYELILVLPYLIQVPVFLTMYYLFLNINTEVFLGKSFLFVSDLSKPDSFYKYYLFNINILPLIMTLINIMCLILYNSSNKFLEVSLPIIFLIILYDKPSALVLYWTFNNIIYLFDIILEKYF